MRCRSGWFSIALDGTGIVIVASRITKHTKAILDLDTPGITEGHDALRKDGKVLQRPIRDVGMKQRAVGAKPRHGTGGSKKQLMRFVELKVIERDLSRRMNRNK